MASPLRALEAVAPLGCHTRPGPVIPGRVTIAAFFVGAAAVCTYIAFSMSDQPQRAVIWGGLALGVFAFALLCACATVYEEGLGLARWRLGSWMLLWYGLAYGLATMTWTVPGDGVSAEVALPSILSALGLTGCALAAWALGYCAGPKRPAARAAVWVTRRVGRSFAAEVRSPVAPWALYALGIGGRLASVAVTGRFGYSADLSGGGTSWYSQFLATLSLCAPLAVCAAALQAFRERIRPARVTLTVLAVSEFAFGAAGGGKQGFVITVLAIVIPFSLARGRIPVWILATTTLVFLIGVIPFSQAYRHAIHNGGSPLPPSEAVADAPAIFGEVVASGDPLPLIPQSAGLPAATHHGDPEPSNHYAAHAGADPICQHGPAHHCPVGRNGAAGTVARETDQPRRRAGQPGVFRAHVQRRPHVNGDYA